MAAQIGSAGDEGGGRIFAVANQKGGVGKTTTAINLGTALASVGKRVLVVDLDPQGNASTGLGIDRHNRRESTYHLLHGDIGLERAAAKSNNVPGLYVIPSTEELSGADIELMGEKDRAHRLRNALRDAEGRAPAGYDFILIDCPPSLNILTVNALTAADAVIVPLQCEFFALEGLSQLLRTVHRIRKGLNPTLGVQGVILTMFDGRYRSCEEVARDAREILGDLVYQTIVPRNVTIAEAPSHGVPVLMYDNKSPGSQAYVALVPEFLERENCSI
ncbi:MAG: ParA family protein [Pseudomonadota bacterium]